MDITSVWSSSSYSKLTSPFELMDALCDVMAQYNEIERQHEIIQICLDDRATSNGDKIMMIKAALQG